MENYQTQPLKVGGFAYHVHVPRRNSVETVVTMTEDDFIPIEISISSEDPESSDLELHRVTFLNAGHNYLPIDAIEVRKRFGETSKVTLPLVANRVMRRGESLLVTLDNDLTKNFSSVRIMVRGRQHEQHPLATLPFERRQVVLRLDAKKNGGFEGRSQLDLYRPRVFFLYDKNNSNLWNVVVTDILVGSYSQFPAAQELPLSLFAMDVPFDCELVPIGVEHVVLVKTKDLNLPENGPESPPHEDLKCFVIGHVDSKTSPR